MEPATSRTFEPDLRALFRPARSRDDRRIAGIAGGMAHRLGVSAVFVRAAFLALIFAYGLGGVVYLILWAIALDTDATVDQPRAHAVGRQQVALLLMFTGLVAALLALEWWIFPAATIPTTVLMFATAGILDRGEGSTGPLTQEERPRYLQVLLGSLLIFAAIVVFATSSQAELASVGGLLAGFAMGIGGLGFVFSGWVGRLFGDLTSEREARVRGEERADFAAHLHDSVLQTLALIQRSDDPAEMNVLARGQERELRDWLYTPTKDGPEHLSGSLQERADRVERDHRVPVEVIVVADIPMTGELRVLSAAAGEAMTNAARHSGADKVAVYAEQVDGVVEVFVTDHGSGFDVVAVPPDRKGISESIQGRMQRVGGQVSISTGEDGTEVALSLPVEVST